MYCHESSHTHESITLFISNWYIILLNKGNSFLTEWGFILWQGWLWRMMPSALYRRVLWWKPIQVSANKSPVFKVVSKAKQETTWNAAWFMLRPRLMVLSLEQPTAHSLSVISNPRHIITLLSALVKLTSRVHRTPLYKHFHPVLTEDLDCIILCYDLVLSGMLLLTFRKTLHPYWGLWFSPLIWKQYVMSKL
jgi:hypothetical protein